MPTVTVDVDVEMRDFDTEDLKKELERRGCQGITGGYDPAEGKNSEQLLEAVYESRRRGDSQRALELIDRLIYDALGRIV